MTTRQNRTVRRQTPALLSRHGAGGRHHGPRFECFEPRHLLSSGFLFYDIDEVYSQLDETLADLRAPEEARRFGAAVADLGDIDGDGVPDFIVGAPGLTGEEGFGQFEGKAFVFSGRTFDVLHTFTDGFAGFGASVAGPGDLDGDGVPDIAIGSPRAGGLATAGDLTGAVFFYSGADGALLYMLQGSAPGNLFGHDVEVLVDYDSDGATELAIGAPGAGPNGEGQVFVISGADGAVRDTLTGEASGDLFGFAIGRHTNDGGFVVGAPGHDGPAGEDAGKAYAYEGATTALRWTAEGEVAGSEFGYAVSTRAPAFGGAFGFTSEHLDSVLIGAPGFGLGEFDIPDSPDRGKVYLYHEDGALDDSQTGLVAGNRFGAAVNWGYSAAFNFLMEDRLTLVALVGSPGAGLGGQVITLDPDFFSTRATANAPDPAAALGSAVGLIGDLEGEGFGNRFLAMPDARDDSGNLAGRLIVSSRLTLNPASRPIAISPDGQTLVFLAGPSTELQVPHQLIVSPTFLRRVSSMDGFSLPDTDIDVDDSGRILMRSQIFVDGVIHDLDSLFTSVDGPDLQGGGLTGVALGEQGQILVRRSSGKSNLSAGSAWVIEDGVLRYLWDGFISNINSGGVILGTRWPGSGVGVTTLRLADGSFIDIPGLFNAGAISDSGLIAGIDADQNLAVWRDGVITSLGRIEGWGNVLPYAMNDAGEIIGTYTVPGGGATSHFYYSAETGVIDVTDLIIAGLPDGFGGDPNDVNEVGPRFQVLDILEDGRIIGHTGRTRGFVLVPQSAGPYTSPATPVPALTSNGIVVAGVNENGEPILFQQSLLPSGWTAVDVAAFVNAPLTDGNAITFEDPKDGRVYMAAATEDGLVLGRRDANNVWTFRNLNEELDVDELIVTDIVHLQTVDNTINIAGLSADGELLMFFQTGAGDENGLTWEFTNVYDDHLDPQGVERPRFVGDLIAYTTAWNALNFAGIDENGDIQIVWWARDLESGLWTANNLSDAAGTPRVAGGLSVYLTPWSGINLAAATAFGEVVVTWWVPQFGGDWAVNNLTAEIAGPTLVPASMTAYTASWGALNIVGVDESGQVQTYWWVPDGQEWRTDNLTAQVSSPELPAFTPLRALRGLAEPDGLNVFGLTLEDQVVRLHWTPEQGWLFENLSTAAVVA